MQALLVLLVYACHAEGLAPQSIKSYPREQLSLPVLKRVQGGHQPSASQSATGGPGKTTYHGPSSEAGEGRAGAIG